MALTRYEFEVLSFLEREKKGIYPIRHLSDTLCISGSAVSVSIPDGGLILQCISTRTASPGEK